MNIWDILEIEYTTDENEIRDAYAECAKKYHPEEHPEEFKRLQTAYKQALKIARNAKKMPEERIQRIENDDDYFYFIGYDEYFTETDEEAYKEVYEEPDEEFYGEPSSIYDYSVIQVDEEQNGELIEEFFWRFTQLYKFSYTQNNVRAWKVLMEDSNFQCLFELSDFLHALSIKIGGMEYINVDVWKYMIKRFEVYSYVVGCEGCIEHIEEKMSLNSVKGRKGSLEYLTSKEDCIVNEIRIMGKREGISAIKILQMEYFVPRLFFILRKGENVVKPGSDQQMYGELPFQYSTRPTLFTKILLVVYIIVMIYAGIMLVTGGDKKKAGSQTSIDEYIERLEEDLRNNQHNNPIIESIEENLRNNQDR